MQHVIYLHSLALFTASNIVLMGFVLLLFVMLVAACVAPTKGKKSVEALQLYLDRLQVQLNDHAVIDPEAERIQIERLQNNIKANCHQSVISSNARLEQVFRTLCQKIIMIFGNQRLENKASWIKLRELMFSFDDTYFHPKAPPNPGIR